MAQNRRGMIRKWDVQGKGRGVVSLGTMSWVEKVDLGEEFLGADLLERAGEELGWNCESWGRSYGRSRRS